MPYKFIFSFLVVLMFGYLEGQPPVPPYNPGNYEFSMAESNGEIAIYCTYINTTENNPPNTSAQLVDLVFAIKFPDYYDNSKIDLAVIATNYYIIKNGSLKQGNGFKFQDFSLFVPLYSPLNWVLNQPVEIARISIDDDNNPPGGTVAELAAFGEITYTFPNFNVDFTDYTPSVTGYYPLPVDLKSFSAAMYNSSSSILTWTTSTEINTDYFEVQRSQDALEWTSLSRVDAAGNSTSDLNYEYIDRNISMKRQAENIFYYRLKMVDLDGRFKYSTTKGVRFDRDNSDSSLMIYPNPASSHLNVDLYNLDGFNDNYVLKIYDIQGKELLIQDITGSGIELLDISAFSSGEYIIKIRSLGNSWHQKFIKVD